MLVRIFAVAQGVSDVRWLEELTHAEDEPAADKAREDKYRGINKLTRLHAQRDGRWRNGEAQSAKLNGPKHPEYEYV
jgi:hypothetical protein